MEFTGQFIGEQCGNRAVAVKAAFAGKGFGHNADAKVRFTCTIEFLLVPGMQMAFIDHFEMAWFKSCIHFCRDRGSNCHLNILILVRRFTTNLHIALVTGGLQP
jgi:hypothetical protein